MKKLLLVTLLLSTLMQSKAQVSMDKANLEFGLNIGYAGYLGDLQEKAYTHSQVGWAFGIHARQNISNRVAVKFFANHMRVQAKDAVSTDRYRQRRNLSFRSDIVEVGVVGEVSLFKFNQFREEKKDAKFYNITPYVFGGINYFHFNPKSQYKGEWISLQPLTTEGVHYSRSQIALPFGLGVKMQANSKVVLGVEVGSRMTSTDYLDDVSGDYPDYTQLLADKGQASVDLSYRGDETNVNPRTTLPALGTKRGNAANNDWYITTQFTIAYKLFADKIEK